MTKSRKTLAQTKAASSTPESLMTTAMLVRLRLHRWGAKTNDDEVAQDVARRKKSNAALGKYTKILLQSPHLDAYRATQRECRRIHKFFTSPWESGVGILPAQLYFKYTEAIGEKRREAQKHIDAFVREYTEQWNNGLKDYAKDLEGLGEMFDAGDYPEPKKVASKFGIEIRTYPIQDPNDFRVKMSANASKALKEQMYKDFSADLQSAMRSPIIKLYEKIAKVEEKLKDPDAIFRDSLIQNVVELMEVLPHLNLLNDPEIAAIIAQTEKDLCSIDDMKALRKDEDYRKEVAKSATDLLKKMKGYV